MRNLSYTCRLPWRYIADIESVSDASRLATLETAQQDVLIFHDEIVPNPAFKATHIMPKDIRFTF
ncbi:hypothetical protein [Yaniella halotolerans]|uniref:hypothetical protein n=1 Tax=Yaniella halotolerans TaxID=225453 RepID=UPI0003B74564|nr:hypothetical protein [Yaniella halotolerans]